MSMHTIAWGEVVARHALSHVMTCTRRSIRFKAHRLMAKLSSSPSRKMVIVM